MHCLLSSCEKSLLLEIDLKAAVLSTSFLTEKKHYALQQTVYSEACFTEKKIHAHIITPGQECKD